MFRVVAATSNKHKLEEFKNLLKDQKAEIVGLDSYPDMPPIEETGKTFRENAEIKALAAHELLRDPSLGEPNHRFLATGDPHSFATMGRRFLGPEVRDVHSAVEVVS